MAQVEFVSARRSMLSFASLSAQEIIAQHKACDPATKSGPYTYTHARRATQRSVTCDCARLCPPPVPATPCPGCFAHVSVIATSTSSPHDRCLFSPCASTTALYCLHRLPSRHQ